MSGLRAEIGQEAGSVVQWGRQRLSVLVAVSLAGVLAILWLVSGADFSRYDAARATTHKITGAPTPGVVALPGKVLGSVGLVSFNAFKYLDAERAGLDWERLTASSDVDIIGWQEADSAHFDASAAAARLEGWETYRGPRAAGELAFSWRADRFRLVATRLQLMHPGADYPLTTDPFPSRWAVAVALADRQTGLVLTLVNTHLNQGIESESGFTKSLNGERAKEHLAGLNLFLREVRGDVILGVGDFNYDYRKDVWLQPKRGIIGTFGAAATTSYQALGLDGVTATRAGRWIDYAFIAKGSLRTASGQGTAQFAEHASFSGFNSDHRPLFAKIRLYEPPSTPTTPAP